MCVKATTNTVRCVYSRVEVLKYSCCLLQNENECRLLYRRVRRRLLNERKVRIPLLARRAGRYRRSTSLIAIHRKSKKHTLTLSRQRRNDNYTIKCANRRRFIAFNRIGVYVRERVERTFLAMNLKKRGKCP